MSNSGIRPVRRDEKGRFAPAPKASVSTPKPEPQPEKWWRRFTARFKK